MPLFDDNNAVKSQWIKWGMVGDYIAGTFIEVREITSQFPGKEGERVKVYEIKADEGSFHDLDERRNPVNPPISIKEGDIWIIGGRQGIDAQMRNIKIGQKIGMKYTDEKPAKTKGFNALKILKVYTEGVMDEAYLDSYEPSAKDILS